MKSFFKKNLDVIRAVFSGGANKHQKWMLYGTLIFGLIISLLLGTVSSVLLMCIGALFAELTYCFVPTKYINWRNYWFRVPDFKEFKSEVENYVANPRHAFSNDDFWYVLIAVILFIILRVLFLIF